MAQANLVSLRQMEERKMVDRKLLRNSAISNSHSRANVAQHKHLKDLQTMTLWLNLSCAKVQRRMAWLESQWLNIISKGSTLEGLQHLSKTMKTWLCLIVRCFVRCRIGNRSKKEGDRFNSRTPNNVWKVRMERCLTKASNSILLSSKKSAIRSKPATFHLQCSINHKVCKISGRSSLRKTFATLNTTSSACLSSPSSTTSPL